MGLVVAPGTQVVVRDEEWLVRAVSDTAHDGQKVEVTGISELVCDTEAVFFTDIDQVEPLDPQAVDLVPDDTPGFRRSRLCREVHRWDVVVIDECHNLINRGTQNDELARLLAAHTDALTLPSATPHNGRASQSWRGGGPVTWHILLDSRLQRWGRETPKEQRLRKTSSAARAEAGGPEARPANEWGGARS